MNESPDIETFVGDESPNVTFTVLRGSTLVDLTGAMVTFLLYNPVTRALSNAGNQACVITDAVNGKCVYAWGSTDKPNEGVYRGYLKVLFPGARPETGEVRVNVKKIGF